MVTVLGLALAGWAQSAPLSKPPAPRISQITPAGARRPAEVSLAINPTNSDHMFAVLLQAGEPAQQTPR